MSSRFFIVDVFAERPFAGNQLAVVLGDEPLPDERMQLIAAEANYSETTFVAPAAMQDGGYRVRIFTPAREIAFAGHPILGTAWILRQFVATERPAAFVLHLGVGPVGVQFEADADGRETVWFAAPPAVLGPTWPRETVAAALGIAAEHIDGSRPIQQVSAGVAALIVPVAGLAALRQCQVATEAFARLAVLGLPSLIHLHCFETRDARNDLSARFFFEANGAREDPATGNGAAFLGAYLLEHRLQPSGGFRLRIEQGHEVGRPSLVLLQGRRAEGRTEIRVGGSVVLTVRGELA